MKEQGLDGTSIQVMTRIWEQFGLQQMTDKSIDSIDQIDLAIYNKMIETFKLIQERRPKSVSTNMTSDLQFLYLAQRLDKVEEQLNNIKSEIKLE